MVANGIVRIFMQLQYDYFIKDHLGNVRMVLTEEIKNDQYPAATMEPAAINSEENFYGNLTNTQADIPAGGWFNDPLYTTNTKVAKLRNSSGVPKIGPHIVLKVISAAAGKPRPLESCRRLAFSQRHRK